MGIVGLVIIALGLIGLVAVRAARKAIVDERQVTGYNERQERVSVTKRNPIAPWYTGAGLVALIGVIITAWACYTPVGAGKVGIVYGPSGSVIGQMNAGGFVAPWDHVKQLDTRIQRAEYDNLDVYSKETILARANITVNYHVNPRDARNLIRRVGFNFEQTLMQSRAYNDVKDATVKYAAVQLAPNRENIRKYVAQKLEAELGQYSIQVDAVQVKNIELPATITTPLAKRQAAVINAQAAQNKVKQVEAEARQKVAAAEGTAAANRAIAASVSTSPGYIDYLKAQALLALARNPSTKLVPANAFLNVNP